MYEVLIKVDVSGDDHEQDLQIFHQRLTSAIEQFPGFQTGTWVADDRQGSALSLTLWDTQEDALRMVECFGLRPSPVESASVIRCELRKVRATVTMCRSSS